jgi:hypothetical protein
MIPYCTQMPVPVSQVEPAGQHAEQVVPAHGVVPAGQAKPTISQVVGSRRELQRQTPLGDPAGQQVAPLIAQVPVTQVHMPALHVPLIWQRFPQLPQLRGSLARSTHPPMHTVVPGGQPSSGGGLRCGAGMQRPF